MTTAITPCAELVNSCQLCPRSPTYWRNRLTPEQRAQAEAVDAGQWKPTTTQTTEGA